MFHLNITGFGAFHGVEDNPSKSIVTHLEQQYPQINDVSLSFRILDVSCLAVDEYINELIQTENLDNTRHINLHFGVAGSNTRYEIEQRAFNEKSFRAPDNNQYQPMKECIDIACSLDTYRSTGIDLCELVKRVNDAMLRTDHEPILKFVTSYYDQKLAPISTKDPLKSTECSEQEKQQLVEFLESKKEEELKNSDFAVVSDDAGRYLCNYIYYRSLEYCEGRDDPSVSALFVHVPAQDTIPVGQQILFAQVLVGELIRMYTTASN